MRRHCKSIWGNAVLSFAASLLFGTFCMLAAAAGVSALSYFVLDTMQFAEMLSYIPLIAGGYSGGYVYGRYRRRRGLIDGAVCGGLMYAILGAVNFLMIGAVTDIKKLPMLVIAGAVGGVAGVNTKRPQKLRE